MTLSFDDIRDWVKKEANFFRIHLLFFLLLPLVAAGIFVAANGQYPVGKCHFRRPQLSYRAQVERRPQTGRWPCVPDLGTNLSMAC